MIKMILCFIGFVWIVYGGYCFMFAVDEISRHDQKISVFKIGLLAFVCAILAFPMRIFAGFKNLFA